MKADDILVLRNAGPKGAPGMPEAGSFPIPMKLARAGVKDMIRISDARMSGTAFGTIVLHVAPESAVGGPLALVKTGDRITLDVPNRKLELLVPIEELDEAQEGVGSAAAASRQRPRLHRPVPPHRAAGRRRRGLRFPRAGEEIVPRVGPQSCGPRNNSTTAATPGATQRRANRKGRPSAALSVVVRP